MDDAFTATHAAEDEAQLPTAIRAAAAQLREKFAGQDIPVLHWNDSWVAMPLTLDVELPGRGPVNGVDIRKQEPIALLFARNLFPYRAPLVYSNRRDFPKNKFPHINVTARKQPAWLCLHRGSIDTWFAEHTVLDLVERARGWFRDAARNRLVPEGDGFERTRAAEIFGNLIYDPKVNLGEIADAWRFSDGSAGYRVIAFDLLDDDRKAEIGESGYSVRQVGTVRAYKEHLELAELLNEFAERQEYNGRFQRRLFGVLVWAAEGEVSTEYFGELPQTLGELVAWSDERGLPVKTALADYLALGFHLFGGVPIIVAVKRPRPIIGTQSEIELLNFLVLAGGEHRPKSGAWDLDASANLADHRTPLTPAFAQEISAIDPASAAEPTLLFGAGALGSKVASHLVRSGSVALKIVDYAKMSPHNVVRHALGGGAIGVSKAEALKAELLKLYPGQTDLPIEARDASALEVLREIVAGAEVGQRSLLDMTASNVVFNAICDAALPETLRVHRGEIAHHGRLGFLSVEGATRNPRLDDLQTLMFDDAIDDSNVSDWLNEVKATRDDQVGSGGLEDIQVGLSCSSATMRLADEVVSFHAGAATRRLRSYLAKDGPTLTDGAIYTSFLGGDGDGRAAMKTYAPTVVEQAGFGWQIRVAARAADEMFARMRRETPRETGGLLVGRLNAAKKIAYVTRLVRAPADSRGTPYFFTRGTERLPEVLEHIERRTGSLLTYVGEWHSHPMGGSALSDTDKEAVIKLRSILDPAGLPTLVTIVTPGGIHPHLFEPKSPPLVVEHRKPSLFGVVRATLGWRLRSGGR
jgi:proteasome lid subunit RPN8/RPN11